MSFKKKLLIGLIGIGIIGAATSEKEEEVAEPTSQSPNAPAAATGLPLSKEALKSKLGDHFKDRKLFEIGTLEFVEFAADRVVIHFRIPPETKLSVGESESLATDIVSRLVKEFMAVGFNPRERDTTIRARIYMPAEQTITGQDQILSHGAAVYYPFEDKVIYKRDAK